MLNFGVGKLWAIPSDDSTPVEFGTLQDVSVGFSWDKKELYGSNQFPVKIVRGKGKIECKASFAEINGLALNLLLAGTVSTGQKKVQTIIGAVPEAVPYEITTDTDAVNLGVYDLSNPVVAVPMKLVPVSPAAGQYQFDKSNGKYIFSAADASKPIKYVYKDTVSGGITINLPNANMGTSPVFKAVLNGQLDGKQINLELNACVSAKLDMQFKLEDFLIPNFEFTAFADASGSPGNLTLAE